MPGVVITVKGDASQFKGEMRQVESLAKKMGATLKTSLEPVAGGHGGVKSGAIREVLVLMREIGRGNWTRVPGSFSLLIQQLGFLKYLINPISLLLVGLGTAAFFVVRGFVRAAEATRNWNDMLSVHAKKLKDVAAAREKQAELAQEQADWLKKQADHEGELSKHIETNLELMRERAKLNKEIAEKRGATPKQLAQMDIDEARRELAFMQSWKNHIAERQSGNLEAEKSAAQKQIEAEALNPRLKQAQEKVDELSEMAELIRAENDKVKNRTRTNGPISFNVTGTGIGSDVENFKFKDKHFSLSLDEVTAQINSWTADIVAIKVKQKELNDALAEKRKIVEQDNAVSSELNSRIEKLQGELQMKQELLPTLADASHGRMAHGHVSNLQQVGAYTSPAVQIHTLMGKAVGHLANIDKHTSTGGTGMTGGSTVPVNYGH